MLTLSKCWNDVDCKTFGDYHDLTLITYVLVLASILKNFRDVSADNYGFDPALYYAAPELSCDALLKHSKTGVADRS